jgi:hypothetical protein
MDKSFYSSFFLHVWPLVCLILMFAHTIWGIKQIRRAVQDQPLEFDASKVDQCPAGAPKSDIKWVTPLILIFGLSVILGSLGVQIYIPAFLLFSHALVHGLSQFGRAGLANRGVVLEYVLRLIGIVCAFLVPNFFYPARTILDSKLATGVALLSAGLLATYIGFFLDAKYKPDRLLSRSRMVIGMFCSGISCLFLLNTLWRPITDRRLIQSVESFDHAAFESASWEEWAIASKWTQDSKLSVDLSKPRALFEDFLTSYEYRPTIWWYAYLGGVFKPEDVERLPGTMLWEDLKKGVFDEQNKATKFHSIDNQEVLALLLMQDQGEITDDKRAILTERLMVTLAEFDDKDLFPVMSDLYQISILAKRLGLDEVLESAKSLVEKNLVAQQVLWCPEVAESGGGMGPGGFAQYNQLRTHSELIATAQAIELMQIYGVPRGVDLAALRSYLRPSFLSGLPFIGKSLQNRAMVVYASKARLESIPSIAPLSWLDYVRAEAHLISSILFFALCAYAIFAAPLAKRMVTNS